MACVHRTSSVTGNNGACRRSSGWRRPGAHFLEYATLIAVVAAALFVMSGYIFHGLAGKWRQVGDSFGYGRQYEPKVSR